MSHRKLSLAAGTVLDVAPIDIAAVGAAAGFDAVGLWFDPEVWTDATSRLVAQRLDDAGVTALDIEPIILGRGADAGERLLDAAVEIGVPNVLMASGSASPGEVIERLGALSDHLGDAPVTIALEFLPIFSVVGLDDAWSIVDEVDRPNVGILVDTLHLDRSGSSTARLAELAAERPERFPYLQLADAPAARPDDTAGLLDEAIHGRVLPGDGALDLTAMLAAVPGVAISVELRSRALDDLSADPVVRARAVYEATRRTLDASR